MVVIKKEFKILIVANAALIIFILYYTFDLLSMCVDDTMKDALLDNDINSSASVDKSTQLIPKIIHQTYKTEDIPKQWVESQKKCKDLHPDYQYILWTDESSKSFIAEEYPWFLDTFNNYRYPIERADAIRYFILLKYGGVYIDLDDGCERRLDPLLKYPAFVRKTSPTGISNDVMGSVPNHPFILKLTKSLKHYDKNWYLPYLSILGSTGPIFVSVVWKQYKRWTTITENNAVRILQPEDYKKHPHSFFSIARGSSWHLSDANFNEVSGNHILSCRGYRLRLRFSLLYLEYCIYTFLCSNNLGNVKRFGFHIKENFKSWTSFIFRRAPQKSSTTIMFDESVDFDSNKHKRTRKDSNTLFRNVMVDLEKNDPNYTDLSN
ncbi:mannosylinositol phosphorylceramide synthase catalytic subunit CSH1 KNAG_0A03890 [Huiozyma naganishii CBS 8797]|uniref:inositol phosphorylceramide mannosyltransferase n=1 Tax=Huiozyma naganishii (strain ATCC MYA-139 / BCRC 22969 / CBS 8797 / KCTC 17520 / NBRC 10181 / NCYC 3082 / Yp74L-3) TaxID=1071383 RepID=J7RET0_HUIN7|nr:hypothetical protein KNAG_0A03890 [Kazachstania naganishii CBS 8797]CCK68068.1 hypothetical protein KNAG_0A03890 [Kazachstania naganishii CBS 8797]